MQEGEGSVEDVVGDCELVHHGKVFAGSVGAEDRDAVGVGAEAAAGLGDVVGDDEGCAL